MEIDRQIYLIKGLLDHALTTEEEEELQEWLAADVRNVELLKRIRSREEVGIRLEFYNRFQKTETEDWNDLRKRAGLSQSLWKVSVSWMRYAAIAVLVSGIGFTLFRTTFVKQKNESRVVAADSIVPGNHRAIIELAGGGRLMLGDSLDLKIRKIAGAELQEDKEKLVVRGEVTAEATQGNNRIKVPCGGEYQVVLTDGTKVWLNSATCFEFPAVFGQNERVVRVAGEAFFQVAHDKKRPFRVLTDQAEIQVLGTEFNVCTYEDCTRTTLASGTVELKTADHAYRLKPGEQGVIQYGHVNIRKVDIREYTAWKDGLFIFRNRRLEEVLTTLGRWYDLQVFYQNEALKDLHFTGNIRRHASVKEVLLFLEETQLVAFEVKGRTLVVSGK